MPPLLLAPLLCALLTTGESLKLARLDAPTVVDPRSDRVVLRCDYDLEGAMLYSVKWYKDGFEFFAYMPKADPPGRDFPVEGVRVDAVNSNGKRLILLGPSDLHEEIKFAGTYMCEVSTEGPPFLTDYREANVSVAVLPRQEPVLEGVRSNYEVGEHLEAECTSAPSYPPAVLTFLLNGREVSGSPTGSGNDRPTEDTIVVATRRGVSLHLKREHFPGGSLNLVCRSTLPGIPVARALRAEATATLAASNQRLAQEPPRSDATSCRWLPSLVQVLLLLLPLLVTP